MMLAPIREVNYILNAKAVLSVEMKAIALLPESRVGLSWPPLVHSTVHRQEEQGLRDAFARKA